MVTGNLAVTVFAMQRGVRGTSEFKEMYDYSIFLIIINYSIFFYLSHYLFIYYYGIDYPLKKILQS